MLYENLCHWQKCKNLHHYYFWHRFSKRFCKVNFTWSVFTTSKGNDMIHNYILMLKDEFTQIWKRSHYLLMPMPIGLGQFHSPGKNVLSSTAKQSCRILLNNECRWWLLLKCKKKHLKNKHRQTKVFTQFTGIIEVHRNPDVYTDLKRQLDPWH